MEIIKLTLDEFKRLAKLIDEQTGIYLPESKLSLLSNRIRRRLRELKLDTYQEYYDLLLDPARRENEFPHFLSAVTTNETYFFRNEKLWEYFQETWIPKIAEQKSDRSNKLIRIWSSASSTGAEAYTAAICLQEKLPNLASWRIQISGTDISERVLETARAGCYDHYAVSRMPDPQVKKWFDEKDGTYTVKPALKKMVTFGFHNLRDAHPTGGFDFVFLRNVLMYFDTPMKCRVLDTTQNALVPGGILVVGDVDPIRTTAELRDAIELEYCGPNLYQKPIAANQLTAAK